jgi:acyl carrier protein
VNSTASFIALINDELGMSLTADDLDRDLHDLPGWDSVHLLWLVTVIEQETGRRISVVDLLEAPNLAFVYGLASGGLEARGAR